MLLLVGFSTPAVCFSFTFLFISVNFSEVVRSRPIAATSHNKNNINQLFSATSSSSSSSSLISHQTKGNNRYHAVVDGAGQSGEKIQIESDHAGREHRLENDEVRDSKSFSDFLINSDRHDNNNDDKYIEGSLAVLKLPQALARNGGLILDGHGALSAGASSRLLYDYDEPVRGEILDYLFKPFYGASLQIIKVEIGGDSQSTDGTEASHQHEREEEVNCHRGYEWWLLREARQRNPGIITYALSWAVPYWVGNDTFFSEDNINYHISWLKCLRDEHPTVGPLDYLGVWNERAFNRTWVVRLRDALDEAGFQATKIIIPDGLGWDPTILSEIQEDESLHRALKGGGIGLHYPCNITDIPSTIIQNDLQLKLWSSEDFSTISDCTYDGDGLGGG